MTTKLLSGTYGSGYTIHSPTTVVSITSGGYVEGTGVQSQTITSVGYTVINQGRIHSTQAGVYLRHGGAVTNGSSTNTAASIFGTYAGVGMLGAAGTVTNYGSITSPGGAKYKFADVSLAVGGGVTNGSTADTRALISGYTGIGIFAAAGTISNFGTIIGTGTGGSQKVAGVYLSTGGSVSNGSAGVIKGQIGISVQNYGASVVNYGTITGSNGTSGNNDGEGVRLLSGGSVINGSVSSRGATITGSSYGILFANYDHAAAAVLRNYGSISGQTGVRFLAGGKVVNGSASDTTASITGQAIGVYAFVAANPLTVANYGTISGANKYGVHSASGPVLNGSLTDTSASITGMIGVSAATLVSNYGTVTGTGSAGIEAFYSTVTNGAVGDTKALIEGVQAIYLQRNGTVTNFGTILGAGGSSAISLNPHGYQGPSSNFTNGTAADTTALISGFYGIDGKASGSRQRASGTVDNFGTILGNSASGIVLGDQSNLVNGSNSDTSAAVRSNTNSVTNRSDGFSAYTGAVLNYGAISTSGGGYGVRVVYSGLITNGSGSDTTALIQGYGGVYLGGASTLTNFGTIISSLGFAVRLSSYSATLAVEAGSSIQGKINGGGGTLDLAGGSGTITSIANAVITTTSATATTTYTRFYNLRIGSSTSFTLTGVGTISTTPPGQQVSQLEVDGRLVVTGSLMMLSGSISGAGLLSFSSGSGVIDNGFSLRAAQLDMFGTSALTLNSSLGYSGVWDQVAGSLILANGSTLEVSGSADSFGGTITGGGTLQIDSGSVIAIRSLTLDGGTTVFNQGQINQSGVIKWKSGVLENAGGAIWGLSGLAGIAPTPGASETFVNIGALSVSGGARPITISSYLSSTGVIDITSGTLSLAGGMSMGNGLVQGAGTLALTRGAFTFYSGDNLSVATIAVSGAATAVEIAGSLTYDGSWIQKSGAVTIDSGDFLNLSGTSNSISGAIRGAGTLTLNGAVALSAVTLSVAQVDINSASVSLSAAIKLSGAASVASSNLIIAATGASLQGGGSIALSEAAGYAIRGASANSKLVNLSDTITGYGDLGGGQMVLFNEKAGVIDNAGPGTLVLDTGANAIANAGLIECDVGNVTINSKISNNGTLLVASGTLTVNGAVVGVGGVQINGGVADFSSYFNQRVTFGTAGVLELSHSTAYTGSIFGFSTAGATSLDLGDIAFGAGTTVSFKGNTNVGILTVSDGVRTALVKLIGDYANAAFAVSDDGHGGTSVTDTAMPSPTAFIAAMAGVSAPRSSGVSTNAGLAASPPPLLARPGSH